MKPTLYLETSVISYLTARPSRDLIVAANQQMTHEWWEYRRSQFELYTSQMVHQEASQGDEQAAEKRLNVLTDIPLLELRSEALDLAQAFLQQGAMPEKANQDALHIAIATIYGIDYLLTWNCRHIANAEIQKKVARISLEQGYKFPTICTPQELMGE